MSVVNIKYNNKLIASTNQNKTYTLNCANQIMDSDLVIEIVEESLKYELNTSGNSYKVAGLGNMQQLSFEIPETLNGLPVTTIGEKGLAWSNARTIKLGKNVTALEAKAFYCCLQLTSVDLSNVSSIAIDTFESCAKLSHVIISNKAQISGNPFPYCAALKRVTFYGTKEEWNNIKNYFPTDVSVTFITEE